MGKKTGSCALCKQERKLVNSHILPQFLYEHVFGEDDRIVGVSSTSGTFVQLYQTGIWEPLLCEPCDTKIISPWEQYFKEEVLVPSDHVQECGGSRFEIRGLDYSQIKLFQLSLLWRMSVTKRREFDNVKLLAEDEENIRLRLLSEDPGPPHHFACLLVTNPQFVRQMAESFLAPTTRITSGREVVMLCIGPFFWIYFLTKNPPRKLKSNLAYITANGRMPFFMESRITGGYLAETWAELSSSGNVERGLTLLDS